MRRQRAQALVEAALVLPLLLLLALGVLGVGRVTQAQMGVSAVVREAARAGVLADGPVMAATRGSARGQDAAAGYGLRNGSLALTVDASGFGRGGQVRADARYTVTLEDLPLLGWVRVSVASSHAETVDRYRSLAAGGGS